MSSQGGSNVLIALISAAAIVAAAVLSYFLPTLGSQFYGKPKVNIYVTPNENNDARKALITVTNDGAAPATNLSLLVVTPKKIISITNEFNTSAIMLPQLHTSLAMQTSKDVNEPFIDMKIRKFAAGNGSIIKIGTLIQSAPSPFYYNYTVFGTYDQGSIHGIVLRPLGPLLDRLGVYFDSFAGQLFIGVMFAYLYGLFLYYLFSRKIRVKRRLILGAKTDMLRVRSILKSNSNDADRLDYRLLFYPPYWNRVREYPKKVRVFINAYDHIRVADFYTKVDERDNYIATQSEMTLPNTMNKLIEYNHECLFLAEDALTRIDWTKFKT